MDVAEFTLANAELVIVTLPGVQRFISEARSTADLHAGSAIVSELAGAMARVAASPGHELIMPAEPSGDSLPNRVVVRAPPHTGHELAKQMVEAARSEWRAREVGPWHAKAAVAASGVERTPGFPGAQWVVVPWESDGYPAQWGRATAALLARKRIRDFVFPAVDQTRVCSLTGRWKAVEAAPPDAWNVRRNEFLSVAGHAKRGFSRVARQRFPSTWSIASAPYRAAIVEAASKNPALRHAVAELKAYFDEFLTLCPDGDQKKLRRKSGSPPGMPVSDDPVLRWLSEAEGAWCAPETWESSALKHSYDLDEVPDEDACGSLRQAAHELVRAAADRGLAPPTPYLAVVAQDADRMGAQLGEFPPGRDSLKWHKDVSAYLARAALEQRAVIESSGSFGNVVYAGGDDLLALVPCVSALQCTRTANDRFREELSAALDEPTASNAVVFFHATWPLQSAVAAAWLLLDEAKDAGRPGLGVGVLRRGGERNRVVLPWWDPADPKTSMVKRLETLIKALGAEHGGLSGRLAGGLERDRVALASLSPDWLRRELTRRAVRHGATEDAGEALLALSYEDAQGRRAVPDAAVVVARFVASETLSATKARAAREPTGSSGRGGRR